MNRYTRDEILNAALNMASIPTLDARDRPTYVQAGTETDVIDTTALSIKWLQEGLDIFHAKFPWAGTVTSAAISITASSQDITLPSDFILDVKHGLLISVSSKFRRLRRNNFQRWLSFDLQYQGSARTPERYTFIKGASDNLSKIQITPIPDISYTGKLWYYALPAVLTKNDIPLFPTDHTLVEYIRIRALEWVRAYDPGTAQTFVENEIARLIRNGLANEPEEDVIEFNSEVYGNVDESTSYRWMGSTAPNV